jgi:hypothetical protein
MDAQVLALVAAGVLQPFLQELLLGGRLDGRVAALVTPVLSAVVAALAAWLTGGLAGGDPLPTFSLADPSPLLAWVIAMATPVYALSQLVFSVLSKQVHALARTRATPE